MRIDAYTHFFPKKYFDKLLDIAGDYKDIGKRVRSVPALYDLDRARRSSTCLRTISRSSPTRSRRSRRCTRPTRSTRSREARQ